MKNWFSPREIWTARLPGLPTSRYRVIQWLKNWAKNDDQKSRKVTGRGGERIEYRFDKFSEAQQAALIEFFAREHKSLPAAAVDGATISVVASAGATPATDIDGRGRRDRRGYAGGNHASGREARRMRTAAALVVGCIRALV